MKRLLVQALKNRFEMTKEDAIAVAKTIEEIFNGQDEVEDMSIDKYSRALIYELHYQKLLKQRREEFKEKGKIIRKYFWSFNNKIIKEVANQKSQIDQYNIYKKIPKEAWVTHSYSS